MGYLRFWDMLPSANGVFELCKADGGDASPGLLSGTAYRYSSYGEFPVGRYQLAVFKKGDRKTRIKTFDIDLKADTYFTIIVSPQSIDAFDDTNDSKATTGSLTIRNYFPGLTVSVSSDTQTIAAAVAYGQSTMASGFPLKRAPLVLRTKLPNGTPAESTAEADFTASKRATLLIIPDSYGRFRPRVTIDGANR
ncbi:MAG TPA: hypothetical protein VE031_11550 [Chthoniobacterales bacterium]|nr:hypothetical protein [Chthoniobacterales bacterium]